MKIKLNNTQCRQLLPLRFLNKLIGNFNRRKNVTPVKNLAFEAEVEVCFGQTITGAGWNTSLVDQLDAFQSFVKRMEGLDVREMLDQEDIYVSVDLTHEKLQDRTASSLHIPKDKVPTRLLDHLGTQHTGKILGLTQQRLKYARDESKRLLRKAKENKQRKEREQKAQLSNAAGKIRHLDQHGAEALSAAIRILQNPERLSDEKARTEALRELTQLVEGCQRYSLGYEAARKDFLCQGQGQGVGPRGFVFDGFGYRRG
jgi:hypothetical protein